MKLTLRFATFFFIGLVLFMLGMGMFVAVTLEVIFPLIGYASWGNDELKVIIVILIPMLLSGFLFSLYFVVPLVQILRMIGALSSGLYQPNEMSAKIYNRKGRVRHRYRLYKEVLTDLDLLAKQLAQAEAQRKALEDAKRSWVAGVSHDLKTPLSYVQGYAALLMNPANADEQAAFSREIYDKSIYITELLDDLNLSFKMEDTGTMPLNPSRFNLVDFLQQLTNEAAGNPRAAGQDLGFWSPSGNIIVSADQKLLRRAAQNLLMNAVLHNPAGTEILMSVREEQGHAVVEVSDNGKGIGADDLPHVFERYYRADAKSDTNFSGGVGLSVVKSIVEAHGGSVSCTSTIGEGTLFRLTLPCDGLASSGH